MDICSGMPRLPIPDASQDTGHVAGRGMRPTPAVHKPTAIPAGPPLQLGPAGAMPPGLPAHGPRPAWACAEASAMASVCMSVRPRPPWMHMLAVATAIGGPSGVVSHSRLQAHARIIYLRAHVRVRRPRARGIHVHAGIGNDFSHVYLRSEPRLRTRQRRGAGRHHSAHAQRGTVYVLAAGASMGPRAHTRFSGRCI